MLLTCQRDFADVSKLRFLRYENYPGLLGWMQFNHKDPYKTETGGSESETGDVTTEAEVKAI